EVIYKLGFKNTGKAPWYNTGANFISIYTYGPKYRQSAFQGSGWYKNVQPAKLDQSSVFPGSLGFIEFKLKAPEKEGNYTETFYLAAEDKAWIEGGEFSIPITVAKKEISISNQNISNQPAQIINDQLSIINQGQSSDTQLIPTTNSNFQTSLLLKSHTEIQAKAGELISLRFGYKNTGTVGWDMEGLIIPDEELLADGNSIFYNPTWTSGHQPVVAGTSRTEPGQLAFLDFKLQVPEQAGQYTAKFKLVANYDKEVDGGYVEIPIYVTDEAMSVDTSGRIVNQINMQEPEIEIGLDFITTNSESVELTADKNFILQDGSGATLGNFSANEPVNISYNFSTKIFKIINARLNFSASGELHFTGLQSDIVFTVLSMSRPTDYGWNDNRYRDGIILRQAKNTGRLWIINKLPVEHYLWGIAETSNLSHINYIKSIIVASRTYALYHYELNTKYSGYFHMRATTADQLYRGYNSEVRRPRVKQAAQETAGQVITYQGDIVVTPYFGHSDGRTRSWSQVWGGSDKSWLVPVSVPSDAGKEMFGHGVGMSALGAYHNAEIDGWDHVKILKHYYTGVEVSKVY
ncbi:hypothetical protein L6259_02520, partial [Candidatus Parcubacteria bacterium]|nr:hypothetical protein [Candidatus Parcubacteria bacterium]